MFCFPYISIHLCSENKIDALFILSLFLQSISTCFGHICSSSAGPGQQTANWRAQHVPFVVYTGLFEMIVGVLTTCHTQYTWDSSICVFFYLIERYSKIFLHTLQVLYMCIICNSTNINTIIEFVPTFCSISAVMVPMAVDVCRITKGAHINHL